MHGRNIFAKKLKRDKHFALFQSSLKLNHTGTHHKNHSHTMKAVTILILTSISCFPT